MRRFIGPITVLLLWAALTIGLNVWFTMNPDNSQTNLIVSIVYMVLLLVIIPVGLPLHSRLLEVLLMLYALVLGVMDIAIFLNMKHTLVGKCHAGTVPWTVLL